jgi:hypothetical protein
MNHSTRGRAAFRFLHLPGLRSSADEHLSAGGANAAKRIPVGRRRCAASGALRTIFPLIKVSLLNFYVSPIHIEFVRNYHGQRRLDALPDLGIFRHDRYGAVRSDANEGARAKIRGKWRLGSLPE